MTPVTTFAVLEQQRADLLARVDRRRLVPARRREEQHVTRRALHERAYRRVHGAEHQVALPVARHRPVLGLGGPLAD
jgi:hypothetical protein